MTLKPQSFLFFAVLVGSLVVVAVAMLAAPYMGTSTVRAEAPTADPTLVAADALAQPVRGCLEGSAYPETIIRWCEAIVSASTEAGLDPALIAAVMLQESGGDPQAISGSGAVGLLQVMPSDGLAAEFQCANGPCFASRPTTDELLDPGFNVAYGARLLGGLIAKTGDLREALRAYGPMDVGYHYADTVLAILERYN